MYCKCFHFGGVYLHKKVTSSSITGMDIVFMKK